LALECRRRSGRAGNQYYEDRQEAARSCLPRRGRFVVYRSVVAGAPPAPGQPPATYLPSCNRADPGSQIPTEWCGPSSPSMSPAARQGSAR